MLLEYSLYFLFLFIVLCSLQIFSSLTFVSSSAISGCFRHRTWSSSVEPICPCLCTRASAAALTASPAVFLHLLVTALQKSFPGHIRHLGWPHPPGSLCWLPRHAWGAADWHHLHACPMLPPRPRCGGRFLRPAVTGQPEGVCSPACRKFGAHTCVCAHVHSGGYAEVTRARAIAVSGGSSGAAFCSLGSLRATWGNRCPQDTATPLP